MDKATRYSIEMWRDFGPLEGGDIYYKLGIN